MKEKINESFVCLDKVFTGTISWHLEKKSLILKGFCDIIPHIKTSVRDIAEHDVMNAISSLYMLYYVIKYVNLAYLILNINSTQFNLLDHLNNTPTLVITKEDKILDKFLNKPISLISKDSSLQHSVKYFSIIVVNWFIYPHFIFLLVDSN